MVLTLSYGYIDLIKELLKCVKDILESCDIASTVTQFLVFFYENQIF